MTDLVLCIDSGNTRLKWGMRHGDQWLAQGATTHAQAAQIQLPQVPVRIVACNVAGAAGREAVEALAQRLAIVPEWLRPQAAQCGVTNRYEPPSQLGADRWAALIGARTLHQGDCMVVNCGTATTIDVLDAAGVFRGGLILPGLDLMRSALADGAAELPAARGAYRELPTNTFDAIASGAIHATLGAIERMSRRIASTDNAPTAVGTAHAGAAQLVGRQGLRYLCVLSGGAVGAIAPYLELPSRVVDNLVLEGVARIAVEK